MRRISPVLLTGLAVIVATFLLPANAATSASSSAPAASPSPAKKDPCETTKSKWAHIQCQQFNSSAPGDEYFGRMKISYLGIDNTFKDATISAGAYTTDPNVISKIVFADEALQRWAAKYPGDPQLARAYFLGIQVFRKVYTADGQKTAWNYMQILVHKYPSSYFGKTMKASLAKGFTEHVVADALPCPTPLPKGVMPERTPGATATPSPAPGQPALEIITPPCVPATPIPSPAPSASALPAQPSYPTAAPSVGPSATPTPT